MTFPGWMALIGGLLLFMALSAPWVRRFPVSTAIIYLAFGLAIGPFGLDLLRVDVRNAAWWLEPLTEVAVIVSLFFGGLKLRLPLHSVAWRAAWRLAVPVMVVTIAAVAALAHFVLGLDPALAVLIGAVLAPTDPVLAGAVSVNNASDHDRLRYGLSGEAGLNDGMAFPFVVLALLLYEHSTPGTWLLTWLGERVLWAVPAGLAFGYLAGKAVGRLAIRVRSRDDESPASGDFLALALIALSYVGAEAIGAWGFLSVFAAGVGLRRAETSVVGSPAHPPAEHLVAERDTPPLDGAAAAAGGLMSEMLVFGAMLEGLLEVLLVVLIGASLPIHWDLQALPIALVLFFLVRPGAAIVGLAGTPTTRTQRMLMGWFGIRGIGSLYYLAYALSHGVPRADATDAASLVISVIAASVIVHGITATPLLHRYERSLARERS